MTFLSNGTEKEIVVTGVHRHRDRDRGTETRTEEQGQRDRDRDRDKDRKIAETAEKSKEAACHEFGG